jgi:signal transduction histidine kinase
VCAGIARAFGVDAPLVRLVFVILAFAGGSGIVLYLGAWLFLPTSEADKPRASRRMGGVIAFAFAGLLALSGLGLDTSLLIAAALISAGVVIVSRRAGRPHNVAQLALGVALVIAATIYYVDAAGPFGSGSGPLAPGAVAIALVAIAGPSLWRLARERDAERLQRIRVQERAEVAARVHDSVLQTLALIQRHADDPRQVATLSRRQERELRGWLYSRAPADAQDTLAAAVERAAADVEELHDARVEIVTAGDAPLDDRLDALVLAAREAMTNAAKFSGADTVSVYVEATDTGASVYVRDRGVGFDPRAVALDRRGIRESIEGRVRRYGGTAGVTSIPGEGTEVELTMPLEQR